MPTLQCALLPVVSYPLKLMKKYEMSFVCMLRLLAAKAICRQSLKNSSTIFTKNNASEREIKAFVLARKNFLFAGSDAGAKALAIHTTLVASAKRNKLNPVEYLADVFARINQTKMSELEQLLPDRWKKLS